MSSNIQIQWPSSDKMGNGHYTIGRYCYCCCCYALIWLACFDAFKWCAFFRDIRSRFVYGVKRQFARFFFHGLRTHLQFCSQSEMAWMIYIDISIGFGWKYKHIQTHTHTIYRRHSPTANLINHYQRHSKSKNCRDNKITNQNEKKEKRK